MGILQARILEWVAMPSSRNLPDPAPGAAVSGVRGQGSRPPAAQPAPAQGGQGAAQSRRSGESGSHEGQTKGKRVATRPIPGTCAEHYTLCPTHPEALGTMLMSPASGDVETHLRVSKLPSIPQEAPVTASRSPRPRFRVEKYRLAEATGPCT